MKNNLFDNFVKQQLSGYGEDVPAHLWENIIFDHKISEKLSNYQPEVPAYIWDNINSRTKKRPAGFWLNVKTGQIAAAILLLIALGGGAGYFMHLRNGNADIVTENTGSINNEKSTGEAGTDKNKSPETSNAIAKETGIQNKNTNDQLNTNGGIASSAARNFIDPGIINFSVQGGDANDNEEENDPTKKENFYLRPFNNDISLNKLSHNFTPGLLMPVLPKAATIPCPGAEKDAAGSKRYLELYAGPDYVFRNFSDTANSDYRRQREASGKPALSYSAGIRYTRVFGSGMSIRSGLNYSQINENFQSEKGHVTQNVYIVNSQGDTTGTYSVTGTQYNKSTNKYRTLDIPVIVGYEIGNGKFHANVNAGAMINIYSKQTGYVLDTNGKAVDISGKTTSAYKFKTNAGVSLTGGVSLYYKLNDQLHLMAEPYIRYSLTPATKSELSLKEKFHTTGIRLGLRLDL